MNVTAPASSGLEWLLDDLVGRVAGGRHAVLFSVDGLVLGASRNLSQADGEHLAAAAAGLASLARSTGRRFEAGEVRQTVVELSEAYLLITAAGPRACLAVFTGPETDLGLLAYEAALLVARVGEHMSTEMRPAPGAEPGR